MGAVSSANSIIALTHVDGGSGFAPGAARRRAIVAAQLAARTRARCSAPDVAFASPVVQTIASGVSPTTKHSLTTAARGAGVPRKRGPVSGPTAVDSAARHKVAGTLAG